MAFNISERYQTQSRLSKIFENDPLLPGSFLNSLSNAYSERERKLFSAGYITPLNLQLSGHLDDNYLEYGNNLVQQYNQKNPNNPLPTNEELQQLVLAELNNTYGANLDIKNPSDLISALVAGLGAGIVGEITRHKTTFFLSLAGGALLSPILAPLALPGIIGSAVAGSIFTSAVAVRSAIVKNDILAKAAPQVSEELGLKEDVALSAIEGAFEGALGGVVLHGVSSGVAKITHYASKLNKKATTGFNAYIDNLAGIAKNAHPLERAEIADLIQKQQPSSLRTPTETNIIVSDFNELGIAISENNLAAVDEILSRPTPMPRINEDLINTANELSINYPKQFEHLDIANIESLQKSIQTSINEINFRFTKEAINDTRTQPIGPAGIDGVESANANTTTTLSPTEQYVAKQFPNSFEYQIGRDDPYQHQLTGPINRIIDQIAKAGIEFKVKGYTAADTKNLNQTQRNLAIAYNAERNNLQGAESLISAIKAEAEKPWFKNKDITNVSLFTINNHLETQRNNVIKIIKQQAARIGDSIRAYAKNNNVAPNTAEIIDVLLGVNKDTKYVGVANTIIEVLEELRGLAIEAGIEPPNQLENYVPQSWSPAKFAAVEQSEFIRDALQHFNLDKIIENAEKNNRPIKNIEEFLSKTYDNIKLANSEENERIIVLQNGASWEFMQKKYGNYASFGNALESKLLSSGYKIMYGAAGKNLANNLEEIMSAILDISSKSGVIISDKQRISLIKQLKSMLLDRQNRMYGGENDSKFMALARLYRGAMLSKAFITAQVMDRLSSVPIMAKTLGIEKSAIVKIIQENLIRTQNKAELQLLYDAVESYRLSLAQDMIDAQAVSLFQKGKLAVVDALQSVYEGPQNLLTTVARNNELLAAKIFGGRLASLSSQSWNELPTILRSTLGTSGITAADWEIYRILPDVLLNNRSPLKSVNYLRGLLTDNDAGLVEILQKNKIDIGMLSVVLRKFQVAETNAMLSGSPRSSILGRTVQPNPGSNPIVQMYLYTLFPFINIGFTMYKINTRAVREFARHGQYGSAAAVPVTLLTAATLSWYLKQVLNGNAQPQIDANAIVNIVLNSGITSFEQELFLEYVIGGHDPLSGSLSSIPLVNTTIRAPYNRFVKGKDINWYKTLSRDAKQLNPIANLGVLGMLFNKYTTNAVFRLLDPEGAREADNELYRRYLKGDINELQYELMRPPYGD